jgi:hypothetical protein
LPTPAVAPPPPRDSPAVSLSGTLATINEGDRLEGVVIGEDASGVPILRTANGSYLLNSTPPVAQNTYLVLQIIGSGSTIQALILAANGVALQPPPEVQLSLIAPDAHSLLETAASFDDASAAAELGGEHRLVGIVLPDPLAGLPGHARPLPAGSTLVLQVTSLTAGPTQVLSTSAERLAVAVASYPGDGVSASIPGPANLNSPEGAWPAAATRTSTATPSQAFLGAQPSGAITGAALTGSHIGGLVAAAPTAGQVLIRTPLGLLSVESRTLPPAGATLTLEVVSVALPAKVAAAAPNTLGDPLSRLSHEWPALREALSALQAADSAAGHLLVETTVPTLSDRLTSGLLFFFSALRGGAVTAWLGKGALNSLDQIGRRDLARRLSEDFADLSDLGRQNSHGAWRAVPLPLYDGHRVVQIMLYTRRHHRQDEGEAGRDLGTRFILAVEFAVTGPLQLDGLVQPNQFDLIVRSHTAIPADIRREITDTFDDSLSAARRRGALSFQVSRQFPPMPVQELRAGQNPIAIVV